MLKKIRLIIPVLILSLAASVSGVLSGGTISSAALEVTEVGTWTDLQALINETSQKDIVYRLTTDLYPAEEEGALIIPEGVMINIDLNGHDLNRGLDERTDNGYVLFLESKAKLTLVDSSEEGGGSVTGGMNTGNGGGIYVSSKAELTLKQVSVSMNEAACGGGLYLEDNAALTLNNTIINDNASDTTGGGIQSNGGRIIFAGGRISVKNNYAADTDNDGIYFESFKVMEVTEKFDKKARIVFSMPEIVEVVTTGYGEKNSLPANNYFTYKSEDDKYVISDAYEDSEVKVIKNVVKVQNNKVHTVEVYDSSGALKAEKDFADLTNAWLYSTSKSSSSSKAVLTLGADCDLGGMLSLSKGDNVVLDLNGHYIKRNLNYEPEEDGCVIYVEGKCNLEIKDSNPESKGYDGIKGGVITGGAGNDTAGGIHIEEGGKVTMKGGTIYDCITNEHGGAVYIEGDIDERDETCFTMTGGMISSCHTLDSGDSCYGGGIFARSATLSIKNATFKNCYVEDDGGAIAVEKSVVELDNVVFTENRATNDGGAVCIRYTKSNKGTRFTARNCKFVGNHAVDAGGAIYVGDNADNQIPTMIYKCMFTDNESDDNGGAISVCDDAVAIVDSEITENHATGYGGGVYVDSRYDVALKGKVIIKDNSCGNEDGDDLCLEDGTSSTARVIDVGLTSGSYIGIGSTDDDEVRLGYDISEYHLKYFHPAKGSVGLKEKVKKKTTLSVSASLISDGNMRLVLLFSIISAVMITVSIIIRKRRVQV